MSSFNDLMQKYVNTDYEVLVDLAKEAVRRLMPVCRQVDPDHNGFYMLSALVLSAVGADGTLSALEKKMLGEVFDLDETTIKKLISMYDRQMVDLVEYFVDNMSSETKADTLLFICTLASVDEKIGKEETAFIRKLFE